MYVNFGIIGCSRVAQRRFLPALISLRKARLVTVGSRDAEKAKQYAKEFGAPRWGDYKAVLADKEVDAVYISTPPLLHTEWVLKAAKAGKHIMCEKPAFPNLKEAHAAVAACRAAGVRLFENYAFLYHPQHAAARALIPKIGGITDLFVQYLYPFPQKENIRLKPELGGGVFHDSFGYPFALAYFYFDESPRFVSYKKVFNRRLGIDTAAEITVHFSENRTLDGRVEMGSEKYASSYVLHGPRGCVEVCRAFAVDADKPVEIILKTRKEEKKIIVPPADQFQRALDDFCAAVRGKRPVQRECLEEGILARASIVFSAKEGTMTA